MAFVLTGVVQSMRALSGIVEQGPRKGERWDFVSMEIADGKFCHVYSCQVRNTDKQFKEYTDLRRVSDPKNPSQQIDKLFLKDGKDLTDHRVKVYVSSVTAGNRDLDKKDADGNAFKETVIQVRFMVTGIEDKGVPEGEE